MLELKAQNLIPANLNTSYEFGAWKNPQLNALAGLQYAKDNSIKLEAMGVTPTVDHIYGMHWMGDAGYSAILHADPNTSMETVLGRFYKDPKLLHTVLQNNALIRKDGGIKTVAEFRDMAAKFMSAKVDRYVGPTPKASYEQVSRCR